MEKWLTCKGHNLEITCSNTVSATHHFASRLRIIVHILTKYEIIMTIGRNYTFLNRRKYFEMAVDKSNFQYTVSYHLDQILQNWCLMEFCLLYRNDLAYTYEHWRTELETQLNTIARKPVKGDKYKWIKQVVIEKEELDKVENVFNACKVKFRQENRHGLNISNDEQFNVCSNCAKEIYSIIECMSTNDVTAYTDKRFPTL